MLPPSQQGKAVCTQQYNPCSCRCSDCCKLTQVLLFLSYSSSFCRWAEPVATDDPLMAKLRPLLAGNNLKLRHCQLLAVVLPTVKALRSCHQPMHYLGMTVCCRIFHNQHIAYRTRTVLTVVSSVTGLTLGRPHRKQRQLHTLVELGQFT